VYDPGAKGHLQIWKDWTGREDHMFFSVVVASMTLGMTGESLQSSQTAVTIVTVFSDER
jgi:hypothetical protein